MSEDFEATWLAQYERVRPHLEELRRRILVAGAALLVAAMIAFTVAGPVIDILAAPVGGRQGLQAIEVTENISVYMRVALMLGAALAMPIIIYEIVAFVVPGLTTTEKRLMFLAIPAIFVCFLAGAAFAYFIMLPTAIPFLLNFGGIPTMPRPRDYIGFSTRVIFWMGVAFQTPLFIALLARVGVITPEMLIRSWRIAVVVMAVAAAMITPTIDPFNMMIVMAPLLVLYVISIVLAKWAYRERQAPPATQQTQTES